VRLGYPQVTQMTQMANSAERQPAGLGRVSQHSPARRLALGVTRESLGGTASDSAGRITICVICVICG
jgi:hypothetical protein